MSKMPSFVGVDVGTSAVKAVLVDGGSDQSVAGAAVVHLAIRRPRPGWSEQEPEDWWSAVRRVLAQLSLQNREVFRQVRAIGLSGQMHGAVVLNEAGEPLRPAILWDDNRADTESGFLRGAMPDIGEIAGVTPTPGFTAPKVLWLRTHEPAVFSGMRYVASAKAYVHLKLTGTLLTDLSDGAGTLWLDEARRDWSDRALSASGVSRAHVPALVEGSAPAGFVRNSLCEEFGLTSPVMVAGGAGDVAAAAIGLGAVNEGDAFISLGTSCQLFVATSAYAPEEAPLLVHNFAHAIPGRWFRMAAMLNGGSCLRWIAGLLGEETRIEELLSVTERAYQGPLHLLFLPYLVGERTPHNNPNARGVLIGLTPATTRTDVVQSVLEGVAFSIREARLAVERLRLPLSSAGVVGGGSRSAFWMKLIASITGLPLVRYAESEQGAAFGAARLARLAFSGEPIVDVCRKLPAIDQFEPDGDLAPIYAERFDRFRQTYRELSWPRLWADNE